MDIKDANKKLQNVEEKVDNVYCFCSKLIDDHVNNCSCEASNQRI